jgi:hypothetical protein
LPAGDDVEHDDRGGARDATLVVMLGRVGVAPADALAFSFMNLLLLVAYGLICSVSLFSPTTRLEAREAREELHPASTGSPAS